MIHIYKYRPHMLASAKEHAYLLLEVRTRRENAAKDQKTCITHKVARAISTWKCMYIHETTSHTWRKEDCNNQDSNAHLVFLLLYWFLFSNVIALIRLFQEWNRTISEVTPVFTTCIHVAYSGRQFLIISALLTSYSSRVNAPTSHTRTMVHVYIFVLNICIG